MYFLELLEKLDDMNEKSWLPPSILSSFLTCNILIEQKFKDDCTISRAIFLLFSSSLYMVTSFYNNKDSGWLYRKVLCANAALNDRNIYLCSKKMFQYESALGLINMSSLFHLFLPNLIFVVLFCLEVSNKFFKLSFL